MDISKSPSKVKQMPVARVTIENNFIGCSSFNRHSHISPSHTSIHTFHRFKVHPVSVLQSKRPEVCRYNEKTESKTFLKTHHCLLTELKVLTFPPHLREQHWTFTKVPSCSYSLSQAHANSLIYTAKEWKRTINFQSYHHVFLNGL